MIKTTPFDGSEYLSGDEMMAEYLSLTLEDENPEVFISALGNVAKAKGMEIIAKASGLSRDDIYDSLRASPEARDETIRKIMASFGVNAIAEKSDPADAA